jgi:hypothetical protein
MEWWGEGVKWQWTFCLVFLKGTSGSVLLAVSIVHPGDCPLVEGFDQHDGSDSRVLVVRAAGCLEI